VLTEPDGAEVLWGKRSLGKTPLTDVSVPCGAATVSLDRERYKPISRTVTVQPGARATVDERLHRPPATLILTSSPPKARYILNDSVLGPAPHKVGVMRFESVRVEAFLPGYEPWQKTFYLRKPVTKIDARLTLIPKAGAKAAPGRTAPASIKRSVR
jgi:hypothetical protein